MGLRYQDQTNGLGTTGPSVDVWYGINGDTPDNNPKSFNSTAGAPTWSNGFGSGASSGLVSISVRSSSSIASYSASATTGEPR